MTLCSEITVWCAARTLGHDPTRPSVAYQVLLWLDCRPDERALDRENMVSDFAVESIVSAMLVEMCLDLVA